MYNLISHQPDTDQIYLNAKDLYEAKYQLLINKRKSAGIIYLDYSRAFIEYSIDMDDIYKSIEEYNPNNKQKTIFEFDGMIADMLSNKKI